MDIAVLVGVLLLPLGLIYSGYYRILVRPRLIDAAERASLLQRRPAAANEPELRRPAGTGRPPRTLVGRLLSLALPIANVPVVFRDHPTFSIG